MPEEELAKIFTEENVIPVFTAILSIHRDPYSWNIIKHPTKQDKQERENSRNRLLPIAQKMIKLIAAGSGSLAPHASNILSRGISFDTEKRNLEAVMVGT